MERHRLTEIEADPSGVPYAPADRSWAISRALAGQLLPQEVFGRAGMVERVLAAGAGAPQYAVPRPRPP